MDPRLPPLPPLEVRRYGEGAARVVVLHGGPGAPGSVASLARALGRRRPTLEPLQRRSGTVRLTVERHLLDLVAVAPPAADLVGWSWGAMLALSYAARFPGRVHSLALVGCGTYDEATRALYRSRFEARLGAEGRRERARLKALQVKTGDPTARDELLSRLGALSTRAGEVDPLPDPDALPGDELPVDAGGNQETWADVLRLQAEGIEPAGFEAVKVPVLLIQGREDPHPGPETRDLLRRFLPHLEYLELGDTGHTPWRERAGRAPCLAALDEWLER